MSGKWPRQRRIKETQIFSTSLACEQNWRRETKTGQQRKTICIFSSWLRIRNHDTQSIIALIFLFAVLQLLGWNRGSSNWGLKFPGAGLKFHVELLFEKLSPSSPLVLSPVQLEEETECESLVDSPLKTYKISYLEASIFILFKRKSSKMHKLRHKRK